MNTPTVPDVIGQLLLAKVINLEDANRYFESYKCFEKERSKLNADYDGKWVASLNSQIYVADTRQELQKIIHDKPHANRAYIEHIGRII